MEEKELKTSLKQRIFIGVIAVLLLGSMIAGYALIVAGGNGSGNTSVEDTSVEDTSAEGVGSEISEEKIAQYTEEYNEIVTEFMEETKDDFNNFIQYKSEVKAFNETSANENGVQTKDLKEGSGRKIGENDTDYLAYYVGWCADETIFDSSYNNNENPTAFIRALDASLGMIEGWNTGMEGMKLGGVRRITIPGELAYGDAMELCGGYNKPLRFLVMPVAKEEPLASLAQKLDTAFMKVQYANYGIDYETMMEQ